MKVLKMATLAPHSRIAYESKLTICSEVKVFLLSETSLSGAGSMSDWTNR
jgi:hypothetical protein